MADPNPLYPPSYWTYDWLITPAALAVGTKPPTTILDQRFLLTMSGVVSGDRDPTMDNDDWAVLKGTSNSAWLATSASFNPGGTNSLDWGVEGEGPLYHAIDNYFPDIGSKLFPRPYYPWEPAFLVEKAVSYVGLNGTFDADQSFNAGYAVKEWRYILGPRHSAYLGSPVINDIFNFIEVDIGVRDNDAWILKLGFHITLLWHDYARDTIFWAGD
jgi:hypothetical protein